MLDKIAIKYSFFIAIAFAISLPDFILLLLEQNLGIPQFPLQKFVFIILPILLIATINKQFHVNNIVYVVIFSGLFYLNETNLFHNVKEPEVEFNKKIIFIYVSFITLLNLRMYNFSLKEINKWSIILIFVFVFLTYLSYLGFLKNSGSLFSLMGSEDDRISFSLFNINIISYLCLWAITLLLIYYKDSPPFNLSKSIFVFLICFFFIMMLINASRGSFIVLALVLFALYSQEILKNPLYIILSIFFAGILVLIPNLDIFDKFLIVNRFTETSNNDSRLYQIQATIEQFSSSPFTGHGYGLAAGNLFHGITRSNFQYTQIMGAGGLLLFVPFIVMLYKFFVNKIKNITNKYGIALMLFGFVYLCFEQPNVFLSLIVLNVFLLSYDDIY